MMLEDMWGYDLIIEAVGKPKNRDPFDRYKPARAAFLDAVSDPDIKRATLLRLTAQRPTDPGVSSKVVAACEYESNDAEFRLSGQ